jgi:putative protein kinase ArgK-like GTPase of G3E family
MISIPTHRAGPPDRHHRLALAPANLPWSITSPALRMTGTDQRLASFAVDPSSPFTGGALLGDRVRMRDLAGDPGVFIRSMAARGALGGLARSTAAAAQVLDAAGLISS